MWWSKDFDDSRWEEGKGPFGNQGNHVGTNWSTPDIWLRRHFNPGALTADQVQNIVVTEIHESILDFYIDAQKIDSQRGNNRAGELHYEHRPISPSVREAVLPDADNMMAVHCHSNGSQQYFDAGLAIRIPQSDETRVPMQQQPD